MKEFFFTLLLMITISFATYAFATRTPTYDNVYVRSDNFVTCNSPIIAKKDVTIECHVPAYTAYPREYSDL